MIEKYLTKDYLTEICKNIGMYPEVTEALLELMETHDMRRYEDVFCKLLCRETMFAAGEYMHEKIEPMENGGYLCLLLYLVASGYTHERYKALGIGDDVFYNTIDAFREYVHTYQKANGEYGFAVTTWPVRHINCVLFQLGRLGFEMYDYDHDVYDGEVCIIQKGEPVVHVHVPANGKLDHDAVIKAYGDARLFFEKYFPDFQPAYFCCSSWLLYPGLKELLPEESNILKFQNDFKIYRVYEGNQDPLERVFGHAYDDLDRYQPKTTLEKNMVAYLKEGKMLGGASGYFKY